MHNSKWDFGDKFYRLFYSEYCLQKYFVGIDFTSQYIGMSHLTFHGWHQTNWEWNNTVIHTKEYTLMAFHSGQYKFRCYNQAAQEVYVVAALVEHKVAEYNSKGCKGKIHQTSQLLIEIQKWNKPNVKVCRQQHFRGWSQVQYQYTHPLPDRHLLKENSRILLKFENCLWIVWLATLWPFMDLWAPNLAGRQWVAYDHHTIRCADDISFNMRELGWVPHWQGALSARHIVI